MPREVFMSGVDQSKVDYSTEKFLDEVEKKLNYKNGIVDITIQKNK